MSDDYEMSALTDEERERFDDLSNLLAGRYENAETALFRAELDGHEVALVVAVADEQDGPGMGVAPLAILVDSSMFARLKPCVPADAQVTGGKFTG